MVTRVHQARFRITPDAEPRNTPHCSSYAHPTQAQIAAQLFHSEHHKSYSSYHCFSRQVGRCHVLSAPPPKHACRHPRFFPQALAHPPVWHTLRVGKTARCRQSLDGIFTVSGSALAYFCFGFSKVQVEHFFQWNILKPLVFDLWRTPTSRCTLYPTCVSWRVINITDDKPQALLFWEEGGSTAEEVNIITLS